MKVSKVFTATIWNILDRFYSQILKFFIAILLARILKPEDFGVVAIAISIMIICQSLTDSGFLNALIHKKDVDENDFSTVFYFSFYSSLILIFLLYITSPMFSDFFQIPLLKDIIRLFSISIFFNSICVVPRAKLHMILDFKSQAKVNSVSITLSSLLGVILALENFGVWSLVYQYISFTFFSCIYFYILTKWRPVKKFSKASFIRLFGFSFKTVLANLLSRLFKSVNNLLIGSYYSMSDLGFYNRAELICQLPSSNIGGAIQNTTYPVLCKIVNKNKFSETFIDSLKLTYLFSFPLMLFIYFFSNEIILFLLTEKWIEAANYLKFLSIVWMIHPINFLYMNLLLSKGKVNKYLTLEVTKNIIFLVSLLLTYKLGIIMIIYGQILCSFLMLVINFYMTQLEINYKILIQFSDFFLMLIASLLVVLLSKFLVFEINSTILKLFLGLFLSLGFYSIQIYFINLCKVKNVIIRFYNG